MDLATFALCMCMAWQDKWITKDFSYEAEAKQYVMSLDKDLSDRAKIFHTVESIDGYAYHRWSVFYRVEECVKQDCDDINKER